MAESAHKIEECTAPVTTNDGSEGLAKMLRTP